MTALSSRPQDVLVVSLHTSPLDVPGTGDAGGMNVYVRNVARAMVRQGASVRVVTRSVTGRPWRVWDEGVSVLGLVAGPATMAKEDLLGIVPEFAEQLQRSCLREGIPDVVHSHYWLSGAAMLATKGQWVDPPSGSASAGGAAGMLRTAGELATPSVGPLWAHTMHTLAHTKNALLAPGDTAESDTRLALEQVLLSQVDLPIASTSSEAEDLTSLGADAERVQVINPGVNIQTFRPLPAHRARLERAYVRRSLGIPPRRQLVVHPGRWQPAKGQDVLVRALEYLPDAHLVLIGGPSGSGVQRDHDLEDLIERRGLTSRVTLRPALPPHQLAELMRSADVVAVPSRTESFGLVALEALATGTPVVAAAVGGLPRAVGNAGVLVAGHEPVTWARAMEALLNDPGRRSRLARAGIAHARALTWDVSAEAHLRAFAEATLARAPQNQEACHSGA